MSVTDPKSQQPQTPSPVPSHHLDKRAHRLLLEINENGAHLQDELIDTKALAAWLSVSYQWLEIGRGKGYGPPFIQLGPRCVRYRRSEVMKWLEERIFASTAKYARRPSEDESAVKNTGPSASEDAEA